MSRFTLLLALPYAAQGAATIPGAATQAKIVEVHNTFRCGMCDTPPLAWDAALAQNALDYMNTGAASGHCSVTDGSVAGCVGNGENMFSGVAGDDAFQWEMAVNMWFAAEIDCHNFDTGASSCTAGHMTQVAWDTSVRIGCASNDAATGSMKSLCMYQAPGNFNGAANYPNHVHKCPVARQYEYYTGAASCCTGPQNVCKMTGDPPQQQCGWLYAKATTATGCPAGSCSVHASCTASPTAAPGGSPPTAAPGGSPPTGSPPTAAPTGTGSGPTPAPPPSAGPTGLPPCTPAEMAKIGKVSQADIKKMMAGGTLTCMPTMPDYGSNSTDGNSTGGGSMPACTEMEMKKLGSLSQMDIKKMMAGGTLTCMPTMPGDGSGGNTTGLPPCSMTQLYDMFMKMSEMSEKSDKMMDDKMKADMMKSSQKDMMKGMTCMPAGEIPTLPPCTSQEQVKKLLAIYQTNPSNETTMAMIMNGTIDCQPTKGDMPKLPDCTAKELLALMRKWKKQPSDGEMEKMFVDGSLTCIPSNKSLPKPCTEQQMAKMMADMLQGKGPLTSLLGAVTGGGMGAIQGLMGSMLGNMVGLGGLSGMMSGLAGGTAGGSGASSSMDASAGTKPKEGATGSASTEVKAGSTSGATTTAKPPQGSATAAATPKPKESTAAAGTKETVASSGGSAGSGTGMGDWAKTLKVLEVVLTGECLPTELSMKGNITMGGGMGGGKGESTKLEKPSKAAKEEVGKLLAGCKEASCLQEAAKALSSAGGLSEKAQKTYLSQLANEAAKDAAKDEVKGCLGADKTAEQKKTCFEAAKQKVGAATEALLGNRSDAAKKKVQEELAKEAARDALGDSFAECLKGAGANKSSCLAQISGDLSAAGLEGENPRNIRDNLLRKKLQEGNDCTDASCRAAAKQAAVASGMEEREYASMKSMADVKAAAEIFANCQLAGTEESECVGMAKASWVTSSGAEEAAFTDALEARVKKLGAAIVSGTPVLLVRLKRMLATVVASATSCDSALSTWFATQCLNRAKAKQSKAEGEKAKKCIIVDAKAQYAASVNVDATDEEIDLVAGSVATSFEGETLGAASAARRLADDARRLAAVSETYAAQDVAECSDDDQACKNGEESTSAAGPAASPTPAATPAATPAPTPAATTAPTPSPANSEPVSAAAESSLGVMVTLASALALAQ